MRGDPGRIRQVLLNLADNAIKFSEQGEVRLEIDAAANFEYGGKVKREKERGGFVLPWLAEASPTNRELAKEQLAALETLRN